MRGHHRIYTIGRRGPTSGVPPAAVSMPALLGSGAARAYRITLGLSRENPTLFVFPPRRRITAPDRLGLYHPLLKVPRYRTGKSTVYEHSHAGSSGIALCPHSSCRGSPSTSQSFNYVQPPETQGSCCWIAAAYGCVAC